MTKADMIETLITDALKKRETMKLYEEAFGFDSHTTKVAQTEWVATYDTLCKLGLEDQYVKRIK